MTQQTLILRHLLASHANTITQQQANHARFKHCTRLAGVIYRLRCKGYDIRGENIPMEGGSYYTRYRMARKDG